MEKRTKEDYLLLTEERLLNRMESISTTFHNYLSILYGLGLFLVLNYVGMIKELNLFSWSSIDLKNIYLDIIVSFFMLGIYFIVCYNLFLIQHIYVISKDLSIKLKKENSDSQPLDLTTLQFYTKGITGLIFFTVHFLNFKFLKDKKFSYTDFKKRLSGIGEQFKFVRLNQPRNIIVQIVYRAALIIVLPVFVLAVIVIDLIQIILLYSGPFLLAFLFSIIIALPIFIALYIFSNNLHAIMEALPFVLGRYNIIEISMLVLFSILFFVFLSTNRIVNYLISEY